MTYDHQYLTFISVKGVQELINNFSGGLNDAAGFLTAVIALAYFVTVYVLEFLPSTSFFTPTTRKVLSDYAFPVSRAALFFTAPNSSAIDCHPVLGRIRTHRRSDQELPS